MEEPKPIVNVPDHPIYLDQLPEEIQEQWIAKHRECFPELWAVIPESDIIETLYTMDLRELIDTSGPEC